MLAKMLAMKVVKFGDGSISIYDRGMVLIPSETILRFQEAFEPIIGKSETERRIFEIGQNLTIASTKRYIDKKKELRPVFQKVTTGDPAIEMGREVLKMSGMGDTRIIEVTKDFDKYVLETRNSPIALEHLRLHGKSDAPVCFFLMGMMSGVLAGSGHSGYEAKEVKCLATGLSGECVFEFRKKNHSV